MNDERPIEKLLRRYAKKRRDDCGPAPDLHPATRRLLQSEVKRQFPKPASKEKSGFDEFVAAFARRWIYAVGVIVVLAISAVIVSPVMSKKKSPSQLALNEPREEAAAMPVAPPAGSAVTSDRSVTLGNVGTEVVTSEDSFAEKKRSTDARRDSLALNSTRMDRGYSGGGNLGSPAIAPAAPAPTSLVAGLDAASATAKREAGQVVLTDSVAVQAPNSAQIASGDLAYNISKSSVAETLARDKPRLARGGGAQEKDSQSFYRQSFSNEQPVGTKAKLVSAKPGGITPVLVNFQIEQSGNQLRVIDADGSTYHGEVLATQTEQQKQIAAYKNDGKAATTLGAMNQNQQPDGYQFRVEGTNRTLNQQVVFAWNCVPFTNAMNLSNTSFAASEIKKIDAGTMPQQFPGIQNAYINGRAQIASEKEIEINAWPVAP